MLYEQANILVTVADAGVYMPVPVGEGNIVRLVAWHATQAAFTVDVYSRDVNAGAYNIGGIRPNRGDRYPAHAGKAQIQLESYPATLKARDLVTIAATTGSVHAGDVRILDVDYQTRRVTIDADYSADSAAGTMTLKIAGGELELYKVMTQLTGASNVARYQDADGAPFVCQDPPVQGGGTMVNKLYLKFNQTGAIRLTIAQLKSESIG